MIDVLILIKRRGPDWCLQPVAIPKTEKGKRFFEKKRFLDLTVPGEFGFCGGEKFLKIQWENEGLVVEIQKEENK